MIICSLNIMPPASIDAPFTFASHQPWIDSAYVSSVPSAFRACMDGFFAHAGSDSLVLGPCLIMRLWISWSCFTVLMCALNQKQLQ